MPVLRPSRTRLTRLATARPSRLRRPLVAALLGAALVAPVGGVLPASAAPTARHAPSGAHATSTSTAPKPTRASLSAYGDGDDSGRVHLSGSVRWRDGRSLGQRQKVEVWGRVGGRWSLVRRVSTDRHGDVELAVRPTVNTAYQLRYAGSRSHALKAPAAPARSRLLAVHAVVSVRLDAPRTARRGERFVVTGAVSPAGVHRVTLLGDGRAYTTLVTRPDGSFSGHVRLRQRTTLTVRVAASATLDEAISGPRVVRVV